MLTVDIHEAEAQLSELVDRAAKGEAFVITQAGKPLVRVAPMEESPKPRRLGFLVGEIALPEDFNRMSEDWIASRFGSEV